MADIEFTHTVSDLTSIVAVMNNNAGQVVNGSTAELMDDTDANFAAAAIALSDAARTRLYRGTVPPGVAAGIYTVRAYVKAGASLAVTDTQIGSAIELNWNGSAVQSMAAAVANELAGRDVIIYSPLTGWTMQIYAGASYLTAQGTGIAVTKQATETWPTTLSTVHIKLEPTPELEEAASSAAATSWIACTVTQATGDNQAFTINLEDTETELVTSATIPAGQYTFWIVANKAGEPYVLRSGPATVIPLPAVA